MVYITWEARQRLNRQAGVVSPSPEGARPSTLAMVSDFTTGHWPDAFWKANSIVYRGSGSNVIRDLRAELTLPETGVEGSRAWTSAVVNRLWERMLAVGALNSGSTRPPEVVTGVALPKEWLRMALWLVYDAHSPLADTRLPVQLRLPIVGRDLPVSDGHATTQVTFDTSDLPRDPFRAVYTAEPQDINPPRKISNKAGKAIALGTLALLFLAGGKGSD